MTITNCQETALLSREGETCRRIKCYRTAAHKGKCETEIVLSTFEGQTFATIQWIGTSKARVQSKEGSKP